MSTLTDIIQFKYFCYVKSGKHNKCRVLRIEYTLIFFLNTGRQLYISVLSKIEKDITLNFV